MFLSEKVPIEVSFEGSRNTLKKEFINFLSREGMRKPSVFFYFACIHAPALNRSFCIHAARLNRYVCNSDEIISSLLAKIIPGIHLSRGL